MSKLVGVGYTMDEHGMVAIKTEANINHEED
jgi:hypothetical protein